jgi:hypothetical protein
MAWDRQGSWRYYYRYHHVGGRQIRVYVGPGTVGEQAAREDQARREEQQAQRAAWQAAQADIDRPGPALGEFAEACTSLEHIILLLNDCYLHDRTWRRRRVPPI